MRKNKSSIDNDIDNAEKAILKAKESWKKAIEWWKEFWKWIWWLVAWTAVALWNIVKAWYEVSSAWVIKLKKKVKESKEWNTKKDDWKVQEKLDKAKESTKSAWEWVKKFGKWVIDSITWFAKWLWQWVKTWFHVADAWDKKLREKVKNSDIKNEKVKKATEIWANNIFKILYAWWLATLLTLWWKWLVEKIWKNNDKNINTVEVTKWENSKIDDKTIDISVFMENPHWNNPDYFDSSKVVERDEQYKDQWIILIRDVWMTFYVMNVNDIQYSEIVGKNWKKVTQASRTKTINYLRKKLWAIPEFEYLNNSEYEPKSEWNDVTRTFNIRTDFEQYTKDYPNTYYVPIPMKTNERKVNDKAFYYYANEWITEICNDSIYWDYWKKIIDKIPEEKLATFITAIAKVETWATTATIWTSEYYRRENWKHNCYSFWPYHVLMEDSGKDAYIKLVKNWHFSTEWQLYHPKNSSIWVLWFIAEKSNFKSEKLTTILSFLNKDPETITPDDLRKFAEFYNWTNYEENDYHTKFCTSYKNISQKMW